MRELPNGLTIFNGTPHAIRFWDPSWPEPVEVEPDTIVSAKIGEFTCSPGLAEGLPWIQFITTEFVGTDEGRGIIEVARADGADLVVGSIIAAQAYPGLVVGMTPVEGYERVPPAEKRMRPDKFAVFFPA